MPTGTFVAGDGYGSPYLDALIYGGAWTGGTLKYFFAGSGAAAWNNTEIAAFETALGQYSSVANLHFQRTFTQSDANFVWSKWTSAQFGDPSILGEHYYTGWDSQIEGHFNYQASSWQNLTPGGVGFATIIHELGHGMGLEHPHDGEQVFPGVSGPWDTGTYGLNQGIWTTMSYNDGWDQRPTPSENYGEQGSLMAFDIAALQAIYGANNTTHTGNDVYNLVATNGLGTAFTCIWDAGGTDTLSNASSNVACTIDLRPASLLGGDPHAGGYVSLDNGIYGGFTIAHNVVIENAIGGGGNDTITGNDADNRLEGGGGNDTIDGGAGADTMIGGAGDDIFIVDNPNDVVIEQEGGGTDLVRAYIPYDLPDWVENIQFINVSEIDGNELDNKLIGDGLNNVIDGKGGADQMIGGLGDDTYYVDNPGDKVVENPNEGTDTVYSSITYTLAANVERLILTGTDPINGFGNAAANQITGNDAANILNGKGGADTLAGGGGDDTYIVNNAVTITEGPGGGFDTVQAAINFTLPNEVEALILLGSATTGTGNAASNAITGNSLANVLDGKGGADTMIGGAGGDVYFVDDGGDIVTEAPASGVDTVKSSIALTLFDNVENLILLGIDDLDGTGNTLANSLTGNAGANTLDGGVGTDTMTGGAGNDTYVVDNAGDHVVEAPNGGTDTIESSVSITLPANVEMLILTGTDPINGIGNGLANTITGNDAANTLNGGSGADTLIGGDGDDIYVLDNMGDTVTEASGEGNDTVRSSVSHTLSTNVENVILTGINAIDAIGNELDNRLTGNIAANTLDGGIGADTMMGGTGNDTYFVDNVGDQVIELPGGGVDTVRSSIDYILGARLENLVLTSPSAINGTGNEMNNVIMGNEAANTLRGEAGNDTLSGGVGADLIIGGIGADILTGGADADTFHFDAIADKGDTIKDFLSGTDKIEIVAAGFAGAVAGDVHFVQSTSPHATDGAGTFLFDTNYTAAAGAIYWDDDGTGAHAAKLLATLTGVHSLTANDFVIA